MSSFSGDELEHMPQFQQLMAKLDERLSEGGILETSGDETAKIEVEDSPSVSQYVDNLILYCCLQALSAGSADQDCLLPEHLRSLLSEILTTSEWDFFKKNFPDKSLHQKDLSRDLERPSEFDTTVAKCVASALENAVSALAVLSGEGDKTGLDRRLTQISTIREEVNSLERTRCRLALAYAMALSDYLQTLSKCCDEFFFTDELSCYEATVALVLAKAEALMLKAKVLELQIHCAIYTKEKVEKMNSLRSEQMRVRSQLESEIDELKGQIEAYDAVAGPEFTHLVKEYGAVRDEIEQHIWALKEITLDDDASTM